MVEASLATEGGAALPEWVTARPLLLASGAAGLTVENASLHVPLIEHGNKVTLNVEAGLVGQDDAGMADDY